MMKIKRTILLIVSALSALFLIGARAITPSDTLIVTLDSPLLTLNPLAAMDASSQRVGNLVHAGLVFRGADLKMHPDVAESWTVAPGGKVLTFKLREGMRFHDDSPVTADDVVSSIKMFAGIAGPGAPLSRHVSSFGIIKDARKTGPREVTVELKEPRAHILSDLYLLKIFRVRPDGQFLGCGRFRIEQELISGLVLKRFRDFYEKAPANAVEKLQLLFVRDDTTRYQKLLKGEVDLIPSALSFSKTDYLRKQKLPWLRIDDGPGVSVQYIAFNFRHPILAKQSVRKAFALAINYDEIVRHRLHGYATRTSTILNPLMPEHHKSLPLIPHDVAQAERLLDEAGYPRDAKTGERFKIALKVTPAKDNQDLARILAAYLERVGVNLEIKLTESATFFSDIKAGRFDVYTSRWVSVVEPGLLWRVFHSSQIGSLNRGVYSNPEMDQALERSDFRKAQEIMLADLPYIPMWHWRQTLVYDRRVKNLIISPTGDFLNLVPVVKESVSPY